MQPDSAWACPQPLESIAETHPKVRADAKVGSVSWATSGRFSSCNVGRCAGMVRHRIHQILRAVIQAVQPAVRTAKVTSGLDADYDGDVLARLQRVAAWAVQADVEARDLPPRARSFPVDVEAVDRLTARCE